MALRNVGSVAEHWLCVFDAYAGAHARAVFSTREQAMQFAERHARAAAPSGMPLKWEDAGHSSVLSTQLGDYLIAPVLDEQRA
jgi:hypothetical protein